MQTNIPTFEEQNNELFANVINTFLEPLKKPRQEIEYLLSNRMIDEPVIELFLTPNCNQMCTYCYLQKNKEGLYPSEFNKKELILNNLHSILDYFVKEHIFIPRLDLFSGEIFGYPFGNQIFDIILEYQEKGLEIGMISLPTNASFCFSPDIIAIMESYIVKFANYSTNLSISVSYDGPVLDLESRPVLGKKIHKDEQYLDNLCTFMQKHHYGFHPMISPYGIEKQIDNYKEWIKLIKKYFPVKYPLQNHGLIMQLETREQGWTFEKITEYLKWLKFLIDTDIKEFFEDNLDDFKSFVVDKKRTDTILREKGYIPDGTWSPYFPYNIDNHNAYLGCSLGKTIMIRVGDLAIVPCHRTSYSKYLLGHYVLDDNGAITGVKCDNFALTSAIYVTGFLTKPVCSTCAIGKYCIKYCMGANHEANQELFYPEESNCELQKAKIYFLYLYFNKLGITNHKQLNEAYEALKTQEPEVINKWYNVIQQIISNS